MAENFIIEEGNGATGAPVWTAMSVIVTGRYCTADMYNPGTNYPCKVPTSMFNYSYWKTHRANVSGQFNSIRDIMWYCDGTVSDDWDLDPDNDGGLFIGNRDTDPDHGATAYQQATGTLGTTGHWMGDAVNGHTYYNGQTTPAILADNCTAASPHWIDDTIYTTSFTSKMWVTQLVIPPTAGHGELTAKTFTVTYSVY